MAELIPFRGILYNVSKVSSENVLAPPYDLITPEYHEELDQRSPYNVVRIDFGKEQPGDNETGNKYTRAKRYLKEWINERIMLMSKTPSFYAYEMVYSSGSERKDLSDFLDL